jgi:hypothetical protein
MAFLTMEDYRPQKRDSGTALAGAFFLQLRRFVGQTHPSLEEP